jgi:hypothetical protein
MRLRRSISASSCATRSALHRDRYRPDHTSSPSLISANCSGIYSSPRGAVDRAPPNLPIFHRNEHRTNSLPRMARRCLMPRGLGTANFRVTFATRWPEAARKCECGHTAGPDILAVTSTAACVTAVSHPRRPRIESDLDPQRCGVTRGNNSPPRSGADQRRGISARRPRLTTKSHRGLDG